MTSEDVEGLTEQVTKMTIVEPVEIRKALVLRTEDQFIYLVILHDPPYRSTVAFRDRMPPYEQDVRRGDIHVVRVQRVSPPPFVNYEVLEFVSFAMRVLAIGNHFETFGTYRNSVLTTLQEGIVLTDDRNIYSHQEVDEKRPFFIVRFQEFTNRLSDYQTNFYAIELTPEIIPKPPTPVVELQKQLALVTQVDQDNARAFVVTLSRGEKTESSHGQIIWINSEKESGRIVKIDRTFASLDYECGTYKIGATMTPDGLRAVDFGFPIEYSRNLETNQSFYAHFNVIRYEESGNQAVFWASFCEVVCRFAIMSLIKRRRRVEHLVFLVIVVDDFRAFPTITASPCRNSTAPSLSRADGRRIESRTRNEDRPLGW
ncbi:unnamed protein product [Caenorhabditis auriculariae]|uniref:Uncharacterized protein n=1 Tax=Caenorhabditis auriculariae TaxID=2777116 RepID=A0A8S1HQS1_9PELO|nr:unnamed protein product [Caenorhabditis auriculariae]